MNPSLELIGVVPTKVDLRTRVSRSVIANLRERFGESLLGNGIRHSVRHLEALAQHQPMSAYEPQGRGADDYRALALEIVVRAAL